jgi:hypothetical protein
MKERKRMKEEGEKLLGNDICKMNDERGWTIVMEESKG